MPVTDVEQLIREATVAILAASVPVQTAVGRPTDVIWQRSGSIAEEVPLPILLYDLTNFEEATGNGQILLTAVAHAGDAAAKCREILKAGVDALTCLAYEAQGLPVCPGAQSRASVESDPDVPGAISREGQPLLQQADAFVPLLYLP